MSTETAQGHLSLQCRVETLLVPHSGLKEVPLHTCFLNLAPPCWQVPGGTWARCSEVPGASQDKKAKCEATLQLARPEGSFPLSLQTTPTPVWRDAPELHLQ